MEISKKILRVLNDFQIPKADGICYLICLHHDLRPSYVPEELRAKVNATGILEDKNGVINWKMALYEGQEVGPFEWVITEYIPLFKARNPKKGTHKREAKARMIRFFADNPEIRKDDVIGATKLYLKNTGASFIRDPHYFIQKDKGVNATYDLLVWIEKYKELSKTDVSGRTSIENVMQ